MSVKSVLVPLEHRGSSASIYIFKFFVTNSNKHTNKKCILKPDQSTRELNSNPQLLTSLQGPLLIGHHRHCPVCYHRLSFRWLRRGKDTKKYHSFCLTIHLWKWAKTNTSSLKSLTCVQAHTCKTGY